MDLQFVTVKCEQNDDSEVDDREEMSIEVDPLAIDTRNYPECIPETEVESCTKDENVETIFIKTEPICDEEEFNGDEHRNVPVFVTGTSGVDNNSSVEKVDRRRRSSKTNNISNPRRYYKRKEINKYRKGPGGEYHCLVCKIKLSDRPAYLAHLRIQHVSVETNSCKICNKVFVHKRNIKKHMEIHNSVTKYSCDICGKCFHVKENLRKHVHVHTGKYKCELCDKNFVNGALLKAHMNLHTKMDIYTCEFCGKKYDYITSFKAHLHTHKKGQMYVCEVCKREFTRKDYLKKHFVLHSGEKNFECEICLKRFPLKESLNKHLNRHTDKYMCPICKSTHINNSHLQAHMNLHTKIESFVCEICGKAYNLMASLRHHRKKHNVNEHLRCPFCEKTFVSRFYWNIHVKVHKKEKNAKTKNKSGSRQSRTEEKCNSEDFEPPTDVEESIEDTDIIVPDRFV